MKKLLCISYCLPPYLYPQSIQVGRFLSGLRDKYDIHILGAAENIATDATLYPDIFAGISPDKILRVPHTAHPYINYFKNRLLPFIYQRPDVFRAWAEKAYHVCKQQFAATRFDAILTFSFPLSLNILGEKLKKHYQCPWIAHQSDPWADNPFMHFTAHTRRLNAALERAAFTEADRLLFTCPEAAEFYRGKFPAMQDKISFINHSFDPAQFPVASPPTTPVKTIRYIGGFYGARTAEPLLNAVRKLPAAIAAKLKFEIVGANVKTKVLINKAKLPFDIIQTQGRVPYLESLRLMATSDALLSIDAPLAHNNIFFPSKLADYIGAQRPIVGIASPGPSARILQSLGYHCHNHGQIDELLQTFELVAAGRYEPNMAADRTPYTKEHNVRRLAEVIDHV